MLRVVTRLAARNTNRKRARTLFTAGMVLAGVSLLVVAMTWITGIFGQMMSSASAASGHVRLVNPGYAAREELMPLYENLPDVETVLEKVRAFPGVHGAEPRIVTGATVTVGEEIGEVFAPVVGATESYFRHRVGAVDKLAAGRWFRPDADELVVGQRVAQELEAELGDEVVLLGMSQYGSMSPIKGRLVGITRGGNAFIDQQVMVPLAKAQWMADLAGGATEVLVYGEAYADAGALAAAMRAAPDLQEYSIAAWDERQPLAGVKQTVTSVRATMFFIVIFLAALGIWNTMMMSVLERSHEIGVLRAMGMSRLGVVGMFLGESLTIAVLGGLGGVALGSIPSWFLETYGVRLGEDTVNNMGTQFPISDTVYGDLSLSAVVTAFALGLVMAILGSLIPALRASSIPPVVAMRSGR